MEQKIIEWNRTQWDSKADAYLWRLTDHREEDSTDTQRDDHSHRTESIDHEVDVEIRIVADLATRRNRRHVRTVVS